MNELMKREGFDAQGVMVLNEGNGRVNMISPVTTIKQASPYYNVLTAVVKLEAPRDFYKIPSNGRYAPSTVGLFKLADAAGIEIISSKSQLPSVCERCKEMNRGQVVKCWECPHQYDAMHQVVMAQQQPDGTWKEFTATYELDFVTVEAEIKARQGNRTEQELNQKRRHRRALAESGAFARCLRKLLNISSYTEEEINRPFLVHRLYMDISKLPEKLQAQALVASRQVLDHNRELMRGPESELAGWDISEPKRIEAPVEPEPELEVSEDGEIIEVAAKDTEIDADAEFFAQATEDLPADHWSRNQEKVAKWYAVVAHKFSLTNAQANELIPDLGKYETGQQAYDALAAKVKEAAK